MRQVRQECAEATTALVPIEKLIQPRTAIMEWECHKIRKDNELGDVLVKFVFPTTDGKASQLIVPLGEAVSARTITALHTKAASLPQVRKNASVFLQSLIDDTTAITTAPTRPGFVDLTLAATDAWLIHAGGGLEPHPLRDESVEAICGDGMGFQAMMAVASHSSYGILTIGAALAACLPSYVAFRSGQTGHGRIVSESFVLNLSGPSGAGKTLVSRAALSLAANPDTMSSTNFSPRGLAELAYAHHDGLTVIDDFEKADSDKVGSAVRALISTIGGGQSRRISTGVDQSRFPNLAFSTIGISSSVEPLSVLAAKHKQSLSKGDRVRIFDVAVPDPKEGGVFDFLDGTAAERAKQSVVLAQQLDAAILANFGLAIPHWYNFLLKGDRTSRIDTLVTEFLECVGPLSDGWEKRFATKFAMIYAACVLGQEARLVPWSKSRSGRALRRRYRAARAAVGDPKARLHLAPRRLHWRLCSRGRVMKADRADGRLSERSSHTQAIRYRQKGRQQYAIFDDLIDDLAAPGGSRQAVITHLRGLGILDAAGHGHAGTTQERVDHMYKGKRCDRIRVWRLNASKLEEFVGKPLKTRRKSAS